MRKLAAKTILTLLLTLSLGIQSYALEIPGYEGGIQNEMTYREVIFVTGEPIVVQGTVTVQDRADRITYTYRNLSNAEKNVTLTRNVTLTKETVANGKDQKTEVLSLSRYRETINANGVRYETTEAQHPWSKAQVFHEKPGVTYFAGNWDGTKVYTINRNEGTVIVESQGTVVGYDHHWGATQTQTIQHYIQYQRNGNNGEDGLSWEGTAEVSVVHNRTKDYNYEANAPSQISFRGGYLLTEKEENILKYSYNLPRLGENGSQLIGRNTDTNSITLYTNPINKRLTIPAMRDVSGHWLEREVLLLASLEALSPTNTNFGPDLPMSRGEFAKALGVVMGIEKEAQPTVRQRSVRTAEEPPAIFVDVPKQDANQKYIEAIYERGVMKGVGKDHFLPNQSITRAEATVAIIKAVGFEGLAPIQQYATGYIDDHVVPLWARDAVYLSRELGLIEDANGYFQPNRALTKAEAVEILTNLIHYLQRDIRYDYRERILNY
ncbi:S-layer domain containing protein [Clostridium aceticum]|uniref:S-layer domain containing protein n=1 Tax=Clostridium aceticum TaxID=84022 RepID=A0A0D8IAC3_9CLOT|nr:S-layer homology domain-containing protein [Clostridium aceticum]AKL93643.1 S-layer domain containing protein [Clostridium aceticum]KJF27223.1 hypothetical protein TZ02_09155 [Clostridium aceticum]